MDKRFIQIFIMLVAIAFLASAGFAKSEKSNDIKKPHNRWYMPFTQVWKAALNQQKKIDELQKNTELIQGQTHQLQQKSIKMEKKIEKLETITDSMHLTGNGNHPSRFICPGCNFSVVQEKTVTQSLALNNECTGEWDGYDFSGAYMNFASFNDSCLNDTLFKDAMLRNAYFIRAELKNADFSGADLTKAWFCGANLKGAKLEEAISLVGIKWSDSYYGDAVCPDGSSAGDNGGTCENNLTPIP